MTGRSVAATLLASGYVLIGGLIATAIAWPIYQDAQALLVGAVGTLLGVLVAMLGRLSKLPWWGGLLAAFLAYLAVAVPLAIPGLFPDRWIAGLTDAAVGIIVGWKQLVTLDLPLGDYQAVLIPLLVVTLFGSFAATWIAIGARRAVVVAPIVLFAMAGFGIAFGTSEIVSSAPYRSLPSLPFIGYPQVYQVLIVLGVLLVLLTVWWFTLRGRQERREALARAAGVVQSEVRVHRGSAGALLRRGSLAAGMLIIAVAVAGGIAIPTLQLDREVIRDSTQPLELISPSSSALEAYRQWFQDERYDSELFAVEVSGGGGGVVGGAGGGGVERLRFVVLDAYDGTRFSVGDPDGASRFTRLTSPGQGASGTVHLSVRDGYQEPWVPIPGNLRSTATFPGDRDRAIQLEDTVYYAVDGSTAIVLAPVADSAGVTGSAGGVGGAGGVGLRARDEVIISGATTAEARTAIAGATGGDALHGVGEELYPELVRWVDSQRPRLGGQGLLDTIDALRARGYLSHALVGAEGTRWVADAAERVGNFQFKESRSGHSVSRIEALFAQLTERQRQVVGAAGVLDPTANQSALVAGVGDDEQFAAAGALIAWSLGFEARVVVGVHLVETEAMRPPDGSEPAVEACAEQDGSYLCSGKNVGAWIEVKVGDQWLPLDTSPQFTEQPQENREGEQPPPHGTQPERPSSSIIDPPNAAPTEGDAGAAPEDPLGALPNELAPVLRIVGLAAGAAGLIVLPPVFLLGAKALRRRRRQAGDPEVSIVGAWDELVDLAVDHRVVRGADVPESRVDAAGHLVDSARRLGDGTRRQVAARIGGPAAARLAEIADLAVFSERTPIEAQRDHAWDLVAEAREGLRDGVPFLQRVRAALDPASFIRHLGGRTATRSRGLGVQGVRLAGEVR